MAPDAQVQMQHSEQIATNKPEPGCQSCQKDASEGSVYFGKPDMVLDERTLLVPDRPGNNRIDGMKNVLKNPQVGLIFIPTIAYGLMMLKVQFPVSERVSAGVSYMDMLREVGALGALIAVALITRELGRDFNLDNIVQIGIIVVVVGGYGVITKSIGQPLFVFLLLIMMPLATTELGTDSWITPLMEGSMKQLGLPAVSVLLWTSFIMMCLRFMAGPIVHALSPIGLLMMSAAIAVTAPISGMTTEGSGLGMRLGSAGWGARLWNSTDSAPLVSLRMPSLASGTMPSPLLLVEGGNGSQPRSVYCSTLAPAGACTAQPLECSWARVVGLSRPKSNTGSSAVAFSSAMTCSWSI